MVPHADRDPIPQGDDMRTLPEGGRLTKDGVNGAARQGKTL